MNNVRGIDSGRGLFKALEISSSGLRAERTRMDVIASNIANANRTGKPGIGPYRRREVFLKSVPFDKVLAGVEVAGVAEDPTPFEIAHRPGHPDADADGKLLLPNVNVAFELVDMILATRTYEANLSASKAFREMAENALNILR